MVFQIYSFKTDVDLMGKIQMLFACIIMALFTASSNACLSDNDCIVYYKNVWNFTLIQRYDKCCFDYDPPRCIKSFFYCSYTHPTPQVTTLRYDEHATAWSSDDDYGDNNDDDGSETTTVIVPAIIGTIFITCMCFLACAVSKKKNPQQNRHTGEGARTYGGRIHLEEMERLQQRERAEQFSRFVNTVERVDTGSRARPEDDMIHLAPMTPTAPDLRETSRHSNSNVNLQTNTAAASSHVVNPQPGSHPVPFGDAPPLYIDVIGTDVNIPQCPPPKYEDVV